MANIEQIQQMIPFITCQISFGQLIQQMIPLITCETPFGEDVCELVFGVHVFDLDFGVQNNSIEQPIKSNSVSSGNMSHRWTSAFHIIILITASLSSNTYHKASWRAYWTFGGTGSMSFIASIFLWGLWCL